jgi:hypothetical protein
MPSGGQVRHPLLTAEETEAQGGRQTEARGLMNRARLRTGVWTGADISIALTWLMASVVGAESLSSSGLC